MRTGKAVFLAAVIATGTGLPPTPYGHAKGQETGSENFRLQPGSVAEVAFHRKRGQVIDLKIEDSGRTVSLATQQTLRISLGENPTTGYRWQVFENGSPVLRLSSDTFQRGSSTGVGAGGTRVLEFHSETAGTASLRLGYARASDPATQKQEFVLHVQVTAP